MKWYLICLILFAVSSLCGQIEFQAEEIDFTIQDSVFIVEGDYYFVNLSNKPINTAIFYPFPDDKSMGEVIEFSVEESHSIKLIDRSSEGLLIGLTLSANDTLKCEISYRQMILADSIIYILKSTQNWRNSLKSANYTLSVPLEIEIASFSYYPDSFQINGKEQTYYWQKRNFYPDKDFVIEIE